MPTPKPINAANKPDDFGWDDWTVTLPLDVGLLTQAVNAQKTPALHIRFPSPTQHSRFPSPTQHSR